MTALQDAYIIGQENFENWSEGFNSEGYLKVLPHPDTKVPFKDPFTDWQEGNPGNYLSSWGPDEVLEVPLSMQDLSEIEIEGLGILQAGDGLIPWLDGKTTPFEFLKGYNGSVPGPLLIVEPGDTLKIELQNDLEDPNQVSNLHTHGLHVSPVGDADNVLIPVEPGESWPIEIPIPEDHFLGLSWVHPHLHGLTNEQLAAGLASLLFIAPPHDLPDLEKWNPQARPMHFMALNSFGIQQIDRPGSADDPLNQNPDQPVPAGTPLEVLGETDEGETLYELSDAVGIGFNAKPVAYDPEQPTGNFAEGFFEYGGGVLAEPVENVIHTVNGQYNPTLELETTDGWNQFFFANMDPNAFHVIQLVKEEGDTLIPQEVNLIAIDTDLSGAVEGVRREVTELPVLNPGSRLAIQHWFEEEGTYYFLSNGTEEILGDAAPELTQEAGFNDGRFTWGSQVLATIEVSGDEVPEGDFPEPYDTLVERSEKTAALVQAAEQGNFTRDRNFTWSANIGGAIAEGNEPDDTEVLSFEGTYRINGEYYSTDGSSRVPLAMPMLDTVEVWTIQNESGKTDSTLPVDIPLVEWHPFHIHTNDFAVVEINGLPVEDIEQTYLNGVLSDTIALPPTYEPGSITPENPYGTPQLDGVTSEVKIVMNFADFPGSYVNHCHILFHEDAGMMAAVRVVLNTRDTWLGLGNEAGDPNGTQIELIRASQLQDRINLLPYGEAFTGGVDLAIGDVNYLQDFNHNNLTDNVTDVAVVQSSLDDSQEQFAVKIFDGQTLIEQQEEGQTEFDGLDEALIVDEIVPFQELELSSEQQAAIAVGDIDGDSYGDVMVGVGGGVSPLIEIYSGADRTLLSRITPFADQEDFQGTINLAVGDADGDNFDDVIVGQGSGGQGLLEIYSGRVIYTEGTLDGNETAQQSALLSEPFQPYGDSYQGEIEVTSGYILQRPDVPNDAPVQTNNANITTMAVDEVPETHEQVKVFTFNGGHHGHAEHGGETSEHSEGEYDEHEGEHDGGEQGEETPDELRLEVEFTPDGELEDLAGAFADLPDLPRGEPALLTQTQDGETEIIHLQEGNVPQSFALPASRPTSIFRPFFGTIGSDLVDAALPTENFDGNRQFVFAGFGEDLMDTSSGSGQNRLYGGSGDDEILVGSNDRAFGNAGDDLFEATPGQGGNRLYGCEGDDTFFLGSGDRAIGGEGDDVFFTGTGGDNLLTGGDGADQFWLAVAELPESTNVVTDLELDRDVIGIASFGESPSLSFGEDDLGNATLTLEEQQVASFLGISQSELETATFTFG